MNAKQAAVISEMARIKNSSAYTVIKKIIEAEARQGKDQVQVSTSAIPKGVEKLLQDEGYEVCYDSTNNRTIKWA
jgi:hypothetical protein